MHSDLPGKSSTTTTVAVTKAALRLLGLSNVAGAIDDLTGLGKANIDSLVRTVAKELADRPSAEFAAVGQADREWAETVLARTYVALGARHRGKFMSASLIGPREVADLARDAMSVSDRREVDAASDDTQAYLTAVSESTAYLISEWYSTSAEPNRVAMSQTAGETLQVVRTIASMLDDLRAHLDSAPAPVLARLDRSPAEPLDPPLASGPASEQVTFELELDFSPHASEERLAEIVSAAVVAVLEDRQVLVEVSLPALEKEITGDPVLVAQWRHELRAKAQRVRAELAAFFSPQVESAWSSYLRTTATRVAVTHAIITGPDAIGAKLDVWRTDPSPLSAPVWLSPDEVDAALESTRLEVWDDLRMGPGWRAADELPRAVIVGKVMPGILHAIVRDGVTGVADWSPDVLLLWSWHISQG